MLFIEAKTICETKLNWIMLPAIFISAAKKIIDDNIMEQRNFCYCFSCVCRTPCKGGN